MIKYEDSILRFSRGKWTSLRDNLGSYTIGFGGHVDLRDIDIFAQKRADDFESAIFHGVKREVKEEIGIDIDLENVQLIGVLNDDSVKQGKQHFAILFLVEVYSPDIDSRSERWITKPEFIPIEKLVEEFEFYEYWSQLCIQAYWGEQIKLDCQIQPAANFSLKYQHEIILITGYVGSGKSMACELLEKEYGYKNIRCSKVMQEIIGCGSIEEIGRRGLQDMGYKFIKEEDGHERLSQGIVELMNNDPNKLYVLDGLRYPETLDVLASKLNKPITIIYIDTLIENLYRNYRDRNKRQISFREYIDIISHPVEKVVQQFRPIAGVTVHNNGSLSSYKSALNEFFREGIIEGYV